MNILFYFFKLINLFLISWRLITLQYYSGWNEYFKEEIKTKGTRGPHVYLLPSPRLHP